jgi:proline-serine-threonine phosphatase interacting protein 1
MAKFSQNFWGSEFCSTAGYDTLVKRLKEGKKMCHDLEDFLEKRARIEKEYGDNLVRLAEKAAGKEELGTLRKSWDQLKSETDAVGRLHLSLSQKITDDILKAVREFKDQQRETRKKSEDTVKRAAGHKRTCYQSTNRARATYETRCKEADKAEETFNKVQSPGTAKQQEIAKAQKNSEKARASSKNADQLYQESVKSLEESRALWEREMELICRQFQELEELRIAYLRHHMWTLCNLCSQTTVYEDQSFENVRKVLEECNVDNDIDLFVSERKTGSERPAPLRYINFYHPNQSEPPAAPAAKGGKGEAPNKALPPIPPESSSEPAGPIEDGVYSSIPDQVKVNTVATAASGGAGLDESYYATPKSTVEKMVALYSYEAQGTQELNLEEGAIVMVITKEDEVWWCGQLLDGTTGMFPANYVTPYNQL